jgi:4-aminobutyrate aminotransferase/(S)-3-amino-2-methylpropionate transaminase
MSTNQELVKRREKAVARGVAQMHGGIYADRATNAEIWDVEGKRYIDFAGGIAVVNSGHRHPKIVRAIAAQLEKLTHGCFQVTPYEPYVALAEKLNEVTPGSHAKKTLLLTTGAEALENSVKIARMHTGRRGIISFQGGFHGRTSMTMALTGKVAGYKAGFGPFPGDVYHAPFPNELHGMDASRALRALEMILKTSIAPAEVAALVIEPVQGEGGFYIAPFGFLRDLRKLCDQHGIVLIVDEVQTGFARTGRFFAIEHSGVVPDIIALAKSLAGGVPLSAVVGRAEIMDSVPPGGLGGTYSGSPLACASALAVLEVMAEERLVERSQAIGERLVSRFRQMARRHPCIAEVRGLGGMVAVEFFKPSGPREPDAALTAALVAECAKRGLILLSCGLYGNVVRVLVPLTASDALVDEGLAIIEASLQSLLTEWQAA